jgi:hypothetical protein
MWPFNAGDYLIEVTTWAYLTVCFIYKNRISEIFQFIHFNIFQMVSPYLPLQNDVRYIL